MRWFAVHTKAKREDLAEKNLTFQGYTTFYPHYIEWTNPTRAKPRQVKRPYLPRYIFTALSGGPNESVYQVNNTIGVSRVVCFCGEALKIPLQVIEELQQRADDKGELFVGKQLKTAFPGLPGDKIKISEASPLFGLIAELKRVDTNGTLVVEFEKMMGVQREVTIPYSHVGEIISPDGSSRPLEPIVCEAPSRKSR